MQCSGDPILEDEQSYKQDWGYPFSCDFYPYLDDIQDSPDKAERLKTPKPFRN